MTILVAYSASAGKERLIRTALSFAERLEEDVLIVNVKSRSDPGASSADSRSGLETIAEQLTDTAASVSVEQVATHNDPAEAILELAADKERNISLVVIGSRNRSRVGKLLMGSTTQQMVFKSPVPLLTVRV